MTKIQLRNLWLQVHKWIGLILAVAIVPISLTGAALVWHEPLDRMLHPERHATTGAAELPPEAYADSARRVLREGERLSRMTIPGELGEPVVASATRPVPGGRPERIDIYLDPGDASVIGRENVGAGVFQIMHVLHGSLMIPGGWGRPIVGWIGVAMLISSLTGLWLWWPLAGSVRRGFRWKRGDDWETNLHHQMGFWISVPLFILSLTGVWISFPRVFAGFDGAPRAGGPDRAAAMRARPLENPATPLWLAAGAAENRPGARGEVRSVTFPTDLKPEWSFDVALANGRAAVTVDDATGAASARPAGPPPRQTIARTMRQVHDGQDMPLVWQIIVFLGGLLPALLAITGAIMWWHARKWRREVARRRAS